MTVAGDAYYKLDVSKIIYVLSYNLIISPDVKHNFLLSSKTVFKFSTHYVSIGPSKIIS